MTESQRGRGAQFTPPADPAAVLAELKAGNARYRNGQLQLRDYSPVGERIAEAQKPFAAIITCADSRLSPALVFDIGHGNLFESRVAGNSLNVGTLGSTEYAVANLGVKLILVLGHSDCGAVKAALEVVNGRAEFPPATYGSIGDVVQALVPVVKALPPGQRTLDRAIAANAEAQARAFADKEPVIKPAVQRGTVQVFSAVYDIATGRVSL